MQERGREKREKRRGETRRRRRKRGEERKKADHCLKCHGHHAVCCAST